MKIDQIKIGKKYTYYPTKNTDTGKKHYPAVVEKIGQRVTVMLFIEGREGGGKEGS